MSLRSLRSTSPGQRHTVLDVFEKYGCCKREKPKLRFRRRSRGRNHYGKIVCYHRGGGHKRLYRTVDFRRKKLNWPGIVKGIQYDPYRTSYLALVCYPDGKKDYILAPNGLRLGCTLLAGFHVGTNIGNSIPLWNIPLGTNIHNVEFRPGAGGQLARSAGTRVQLLARKNRIVALRLPSGLIRLVLHTCWASIGQVGNVEICNAKIGKAGRRRWRGWRPQVRGSAINPVDHPHGGGEGRCPIGRSHPVTPWGKPAIGVKTRRPKKYSHALVFRRQN